MPLPVHYKGHLSARVVHSDRAQCECMHMTTITLRIQNLSPHRNDHPTNILYIHILVVMKIICAGQAFVKVIRFPRFESIRHGAWHWNPKVCQSVEATTRVKIS